MIRRDKLDCTRAKLSAPFNKSNGNTCQNVASRSLRVNTAENLDFYRRIDNMTNGLNLISSILTTGALEALAEIERDWLTEKEITVYDFVCDFYLQNGVLPQKTIVHEETQISLGRSLRSVTCYMQSLKDRHAFAQLDSDLVPALDQRVASGDIPGTLAAYEAITACLRSIKARYQRTKNLGSELFLVK